MRRPTGGPVNGFGRHNHRPRTDTVQFASDEGLMFAWSRHEAMSRRRTPLLPRFVLATIVLGQVTIAPIVGFSLTYLLSINNDGNQLSFDIDLGALDWIIIAGLSYGMLSLVLALIAGAYSPASVADRGGWLTVLGLRRRVNQPELIDRARLNL